MILTPCTETQVLQELETLAATFHLGDVICVEEVRGCVAHRVFAITTDQAGYVIKRLSPEMLTKPLEVDYHITSQQIARAFAQVTGTETILAMENGQGEVLHWVRGRGYMLYPLSQYQTVSAPATTHCFAVGALLGKLHTHPISLSPVSIPRRETYRETTDTEWAFLRDHAKRFQLDAGNLTVLKTLEATVWKHTSSCSAALVLSHTDLSTGNVLWKDTTPIVIVSASDKM